MCLAEGAPAISFVWSYNGGVIGDKFSSVKYASQAAQLDDVTWESVLFVKHLQANDFGYYTCVARNELGHDHVKVKLRRRGMCHFKVKLNCILTLTLSNLFGGSSIQLNFS